MKSNLFSLALDAVGTRSFRDQKKRNPSSFRGVKKINNRAISYTERHRGQWFIPEYDLEEIQIAQDTDSYLFRALQKKTNKFLVAGWEIVGKNEETVKYLKNRLAEIELSSNQPFATLLVQTVHDLFRYSNCMWVKVRSDSASSGVIRTNINGKQLEPVAGYFILPFETLSFKTKANGEIKKVLQKTPTGATKEFSPDDVIHFYTNRKPGFAMGTPEMAPVLDDIALLRRLEENIEELIESNLYPLFHYQVGSDNMPERYGPDGEKETDIVRSTIEYMPAGGIYISDHRHKIQAIGSEGRALRVEGYLDYFKKRVFAGLGMSGVDMGEGDTANRATAQTLSKGAIQDIEAMQLIMKKFIEFYMFNELILESGMNVDLMDIEDKVEIRFGTVDKEQRTKLENQAIQLFANKLLTQTEARKSLGLKPLEDNEKEDTYFELYEKPLAESKANALGNGQKEQSESQSTPSNQHGTRAAPKFDFKEFAKSNENEVSRLLKDKLLEGLREYNIFQKLDLEDKKVLFLMNEYKGEFEELASSFRNRLNFLESHSISEKTIFNNFYWRFEELSNKYCDIAYNCGAYIGSYVISEDDWVSKKRGSDIRSTMIEDISKNIKEDFKEAFSTSGLKEVEYNE